MRQGSTRHIINVTPGLIGMRYTNQWSAFDRGASPQLIPFLGWARMQTAWASFKLAQRASIPTHFVREEECALVVKEFTVVEADGSELPLISGESHGTMIPLEWIYRVEVDGSLYDRLVSGKVDSAQYGIPNGTEIVRGMPLPHVLIECTTKREPVDRHLSDEEARDLAKLSMPEWMEARMIVGQLARVINEGYRGAGFRVPDGKIELALDHHRNVIVVDTFGTQDENRIIEIDTGALYSKDLIRNYLKKLRFYATLQEAKKKHPTEKGLWPSYPELPTEFVDQVSGAYVQVANRYQQYVASLLR